MAEKILLRRLINHLNYCLNVKGRYDKIHSGSNLFCVERRIKIDGYFFIFNIIHEYIENDGFFLRSDNKNCIVSIYKHIDIETELDTLEGRMLYNRDISGTKQYEYSFPVLSSEINDFFYIGVINTFIRKRDDFIKKYTS